MRIPVSQCGCVWSVSRTFLLLQVFLGGILKESLGLVPLLESTALQQLKAIAYRDVYKDPNEEINHQDIANRLK